MRVIGIDPGYDRLGVAIIEKIDGQEVVIYSSCIETDKAQTLPDRLLAAGAALTEILTEYTPEVMGVETLFFNKNVKTAIGVAQARGMILYLGKQAGCRLYELSPQQVKSAITGHGNSDKKSVLLMLQRLIKNVPKKAHDDEYDAIAVGVCALAHYR